MVTYKEEKHWLTSEEKAREFHKKLIKGERETPAEDITPPSVKRKKPKRARHTSPSGGKGDISLYPKTTRLIDEKEETEEEEDEIEIGEEEEEEKEEIPSGAGKESDEDQELMKFDEPPENKHE
nr:PREDICTED: histone chaperone ASF1-like [Anolis carolinensis]|eukprot:XP_016848030.1 PREDICTED: histone chaperone ASF1-like [Anolis carolinensis]